MTLKIIPCAQAPRAGIGQVGDLRPCFFRSVSDIRVKIALRHSLSIELGTNVRGKTVWDEQHREQGLLNSTSHNQTNNQFCRARILAFFPVSISVKDGRRQKTV